MIAAKFGDPVAGIDIHMVMVPTPAGPVPTPLPHPFIGVVFDPLGAAIGAAMGLAFGGGGPVFVNYMPTGNTGTEVKNIPHIPTPPGVSPAPNDAPPGNEGVLVTGSKTVDFAGSSESRTLSMVMSCNFPINLPTSICGAVPMGPPVLIGGPEAIDFMAAATQAIRTKWVSEKLHGLLKATAGSKRSKVICFLTGHPVDVVTGELIAEALDASLPGTIPLVFERNYRSRETEAQSLGPGWYHFFDAYIEPRGDITAFRHPDGRPAEHPPLEIGESYFHAPDRYTIAREANGYRLTDPEGAIYVFAPTEPAKPNAPLRHRLIELRDRGRNVVTLEWKGQYLASITDTAGRLITCRYTREGQLNRLLFQDGENEHLLADYDYADGRLVRVTDPRGNAMRYAYRGGVLVEEVHKDGLTFHFEWDWYDPEGWCVRTWGDAGQGDPAVMDLAPGGTAPKAIYDRRLLYDKHRRRTMVGDGRGGNTLYEGNALGLVDKIIDPAGLVTKTEWNEHAWRLAEENGNEERAEWTYDDRGNVLVEKDAAGRETRFAYDELDRVETIRDAKGGITRLEYDRTDRPRLVVRSDGTATIYSYDDWGRMIGADDPMGRTHRFVWDDRHDLLAETDGDKRTTTFTSDPFGRLVGAKDPLGRTLRAERDAGGNVIALERFDGERVTMSYDREGRIVERVDAAGRRERMRWAGTGRLVEQTDAAGHRVRLRYDSEEDLVAVENQAGDLYRFELDRAGKVQRETTFAGHRRLYTYDKAGRPIRIVSGHARATDLRRDPRGMVVESISRGGDQRLIGGAKPEVETFEYDELGDLVAARTRGADVRIERDAFGRITREHQRVHGSEREVVVSSRYDAAGVRVERSTSLAHLARYAHNASGELLSVSADWDIGPARTLMKGLGVPQAAAASFDIRFARDAIGQELARRLPGGVSAAWTRDAFGRPIEQRVVTGARSDRAGDEVSRKRYAWQGPDQIASITDLDATGSARATSSYEYDVRGSLVRQILGTGERLERQTDAAFNLFRSADRSDRVYGKGGVLLRANGTELTFDADGFLSEKTMSDGAKWSYSWDAQGYLREVTRPDGKQVRFGYDAFGRRVRKEFEGVVTEYVWDGDDLLHERATDADGTDRPLVTWVFEPGAFCPLAKIEGRKRYGVISDHLGVPSALMTEAGRLAWRAQLDVYGVPREESGVAEDADRTSNPWRFPGQYEDAETGLYYNRFRYYDPEVGHYISEDPIGLAGGDALFGYTHDPLLYLDPGGLKKCRIKPETKKALGNAPAGMVNPHMHHLVMEGKFSHWKRKNREFISKARGILKRAGVDIQGTANVIWAKNEKHSVEYAKRVYERLAKTNETKAAVEKELGSIASDLADGSFWH